MSTTAWMREVEQSQEHLSRSVSLRFRQAMGSVQIVLLPKTLKPLPNLSFSPIASVLVQYAG
ncbi:MAG: hypothetical protein O6928_10895 [Gammaproteobacteria bacterium]|nr:hypothetical protein [Gammaproteobacteria bacterium]